MKVSLEISAECIEPYAIIYAAIGDGGNVICVNEDKSIVISVTSYLKPAVSDKIDFIQEGVDPFALNG